ncbi:MAG: nicotinate-nucleotide adenylyltransferase [Firmicutes bacterium]|nr:nicotinate-nucleotide adenylyltransferase [Bacillota bacterium]
MTLRLGLMGGAFDPIHHGHLFIAEAARAHFCLEKVLFIPTGRPPHKRRLNEADPLDRLRMTELAVATNPYFQVSRMEIDREGLSYSVDTVTALLEEYGADTEIWFITGADAILEVMNWHDAEKLRTLCRFITATRPGYDLCDLKKLPERWQERIYPLETPLLQISSTDLRLRVAEGRPVKYLLPEAVEGYIREHGLYQEGE